MQDIEIEAVRVHTQILSNSSHRSRHWT